MKRLRIKSIKPVNKAPALVKRKLVDKGAEKQPSPKVRVRSRPITLSEPTYKKGDIVLAPRGMDMVPAEIVKVMQPRDPANKPWPVVTFLDTGKETAMSFEKLRPRSDNRALTSRLAEKKRDRERAREKNNIVMTSCKDNLAQLSDFAKMHTVTFPNGTVREVEGFTQTALGEPLGTTGVTVTRWVGSGMLPRPVLQTSRGVVYHIEEARSFVKVIGEHQEAFKQYRTEHTTVKDEIFAENARIRSSLFQTPTNTKPKPKIKLRKRK